MLSLLPLKARSLRIDAAARGACGSRRSGSRRPSGRRGCRRSASRRRRWCATRSPRQRRCEVVGELAAGEDARVILLDLVAVDRVVEEEREVVEQRQAIAGDVGGGVELVVAALYMRNAVTICRSVRPPSDGSSAPNCADARTTSRGGIWPEPIQPEP